MRGFPRNRAPKPTTPEIASETQARGTPRCRANLAHIRQSRPDSGLGFQVKFLTTFYGVPSSLESGCWVRNVQRFRGGLVFKAHRLVYHSTLGWRVIKKKKMRACPRGRLRGKGQGSVFRIQGLGLRVYMGTSLKRKRTPLGPYGRPIPRAL